MAQLQAPLMLLMAISFLFMCAGGRLVPTPCWQDPNCREDPHPPRQRAELTPEVFPPREVVEPNSLAPTTPCCQDTNHREGSRSLARDPTSMSEEFEPTPLGQDPNCCENPHPLAPDPTSMANVVEPTTGLMPSHKWQDPNCREDPHTPGHLT